MGPLSKYWEILRIDPAGAGCGYKSQVLPLASEFFQAEFPELTESTVRSPPSTHQHRSIQLSLHAQFCTQAASVDLQSLAKAGLCLRCYVSHAILMACKKLASQFCSTGRFTYRDLLPYVLNDDGRMAVVLDQDGESQLVLNGGCKPKQATFQLFTVEVLRKFNPRAQPKASLEGWVYRQTRQNKDLKAFLSERGLCILSDWALLNRVNPNTSARLTSRERYLIEVFHAVYRRDRRKQPQKRAKTCPEPTPAQLHEMQSYLQEKGITIDSAERLKTELEQLAKQLRQSAIWGHNGMPPESESIEGVDPCYGIPRELPDPYSINDLDEITRQEVRDFCRHNLLICLDWGIEKGLSEHILNLRQRPRYAVFASKVIPILRLVYCQNQSQSEVATALGMANQSQVSRVLNPTTLVNKVRRLTVTKFLRMLSSQVSTLNLAAPSTDPDYLKNLMQHIEVFVDAEIFQAAAAEIKTARTRSMNSLYAQQLRHYIETY